MCPNKATLKRDIKTEKKSNFDIHSKKSRLSYAKVTKKSDKEILFNNEPDESSIIE